jgi:hypothetical protein
MLHGFLGTLERLVPTRRRSTSNQRLDFGRSRLVVNARLGSQGGDENSCEQAEVEWVLTVYTIPCLIHC